MVRECSILFIGKRTQETHEENYSTKELDAFKIGRKLDHQTIIRTTQIERVNPTLNYFAT